MPFLIPPALVNSVIPSNVPLNQQFRLNYDDYARATQGDNDIGFLGYVQTIVRGVQSVNNIINQAGTLYETGRLYMVPLIKIVGDIYQLKTWVDGVTATGVAIYESTRQAVLGHDYNYHSIYKNMEKLVNYKSPPYFNWHPYVDSATTEYNNETGWSGIYKTHTGDIWLNKQELGDFEPEHFHIKEYVLTGCDYENANFLPQKGIIEIRKAKTWVIERTTTQDTLYDDNDWIRIRNNIQNPKDSDQSTWLEQTQNKVKMYPEEPDTLHTVPIGWWMSLNEEIDHYVSWKSLVESVEKVDEDQNKKLNTVVKTVDTQLESLQKQINALNRKINRQNLIPNLTYM